MFNFFADKSNLINGEYYISGKDFNHIKNVLRFRVGDKFLVSTDGKSHLCQLSRYEEDLAVAVVLEENYMDTSLSIELYLFQGIPKSDKMELIIQKGVELGVTGIIPLEMKHCIAKIEKGKEKNKIARFQAIAESAAKQSKRNEVPTVYQVATINDLVKNISKLDHVLVPYENEEGMASTTQALSCIKSGDKVGIVIGPEGGFSHEEIDLLLSAKAKTISLGKRILRTETASITALSMLMLYAEAKFWELLATIE